MIDPKTFQTMKPEQAVRAAVALVILHATATSRQIITSTDVKIAFAGADEFLAEALKP